MYCSGVCDVRAVNDVMTRGSELLIGQTAADVTTGGRHSKAARLRVGLGRRTVGEAAVEAGRQVNICTENNRKLLQRICPTFLLLKVVINNLVKATPSAASSLSDRPCLSSVVTK